jgi:D-psicose/D-tagatose/L-ribulose 3-epimerase
MKIGMNMLLWTGHVAAEHADILRALKSTGFDGVEIPIFDLSSVAHYRELGAMLDDLGLERTCVAIIPDAEHNPASSEPRHRQAAADHLHRAIECAQALSASVLAGPYFQPLGMFTGERPSERELDACAGVLADIARQAKAAGIPCALEPLNRFEAHLLNTAAQATAFAARVGEDNLGILYDTFHANIEEQDPIAAVGALNDAGVLFHVHIAENDRGTPGRGHAPIRETIAALKAINYDGWLTIEAFGRGVPALAAATRVWRDFFPSPEQVYQEGFALIRNSWNREN